MKKVLLKHFWLQSIRSPGYYKNLAINVFMGFVILYFVVIFVMLGFLLPKLLVEIAPHQDAVSTFNGYIIYAVIVLLMIRYLMQPLSTINLEGYQLLPVKRSTLINYLLLKPLLNPMNYVMLCFAIPFSISGIYPDYGTGGAFRFILTVLFLIWCNTLLAPLLKRKFNNILFGMIVFSAILGGLAALDHFRIFSLTQLSQHIFGFLTGNSFVWISVLLPCILVVFLNKLYFAQNYYAESFDRKVKRKESGSGKFTFMERFGKIGEIISLDMKLVLRHGRTKKSLYLVPFFLLYGLFFYTVETYYNNPGWMIFIAIFTTGTGMLIFGQWIINWNGAHFDLLMTRDISTHTYIRANYFLLLALCVISFIITTPYFFFGQKVIIYHLVAVIYNIGVNTYVYLFGATFNTKRLELSKGSSMNMQGVSYKNFVVLIPLLIIPILLVYVFNYFDAVNAGLIIITLTGLMGIIFLEPLLRVTEQRFLRRKYALCAGFRKKE